MVYKMCCVGNGGSGWMTVCLDIIIASSGAVVTGAGAHRRLRQLRQITGMFTDGIIVRVVDHTQFPHHFTANCCLYCPIVNVTVFFLSVQFLNVNYFGAEPVENYSNVLDAKMMLLVDGKLVNQE